MTPRAEFSRRTRLDAWDRQGGKCNDCGRKLYPGDRIEYDHIITCEQGGGNSLDNCQVLCGWCHDGKTVVDIKRTAKSRSVRAGHIGAKKPKRPMMGSKASGWKHTLNNGWQKR